MEVFVEVIELCERSNTWLMRELRILLNHDNRLLGFIRKLICSNSLNFLYKHNWYQGRVGYGDRYNYGYK